MKYRLDRLSTHDRRVLAAGAIVLAMALFVALVQLPLLDSRASLRAEMAANTQALAWMRPAVARLAAAGHRPAASVDGRPLLVRVDASVRAAGLGASVGAIEPVDRQRIRVQFSGADFDVLSQWLLQSSIDGVQIEELSVQRASGAGRVDVRVSLLEAGP
jgi:type II secretory pathway component PulM